MALVAVASLTAAAVLGLQAVDADDGVPGRDDGIAALPSSAPPATTPSPGDDRVAPDGARSSDVIGPLPPTTGSASTAASAPGPAPAEPPGPVVADPVGIRIPALDVDAPLDPLHLTATGEIEVPQDPARAGWWRDGPEPGERGGAVILGHVDSWRGPGVFYGLSDLVRHDLILVDTADGTSVPFRVVRAELYEKAAFPADDVYGADVDRPLLRLVTCGGSFDEESDSYDANYVVYAERI